MLIECPDCHAQVSDKAPACVQCGNPLKATTVEQTGKRWKGLQLTAALLMAGGILSGTLVPAVGITLLLIGVALALVVRAAIWWYHG
jgi:hypothetical protein